MGLFTEPATFDASLAKAICDASKKCEDLIEQIERKIISRAYDGCIRAKIPVGWGKKHEMGQAATHFRNLGYKVHVHYTSLDIVWKE